eukprot:PhM_4_TR13709/c0_g1_i1/m.85620
MSTSLFSTTKRHGVLHTDGTSSGRRFRWELPNLQNVRSSIISSPKQKSFANVSFSLYVMCSSLERMGLYVHYKVAPIPKYSYYLQSMSGEVMKLHTAHAIPPMCVRCGHWNVCSLDELTALEQRAIASGHSAGIIIHFRFDEDTVRVNGNTATWTIPRFPRLHYFPQCSTGFAIATCVSTVFHIRIDRDRGGGDELRLMVTAKNAKVPRYEIVVHGISGVDEHTATVLLEQRPFEELHNFDDVASCSLKAALRSCEGPDGVLVVTVRFTDESNPIAFLNNTNRSSLSSQLEFALPRRVSSDVHPPTVGPNHNKTPQKKTSFYASNSGSTRGLWSVLPSTSPTTIGGATEETDGTATDDSEQLVGVDKEGGSSSGGTAPTTRELFDNLEEDDF